MEPTGSPFCKLELNQLTVGLFVNKRQQLTWRASEITA